MAELEIGYLLPSRDRALTGDHRLDRLVAQARRAEELGLDSVWVGDSPITRPRADPIALLAAVAQATDRVTLGTAVLVAPLRHPILLAHQLATLDRLADGRLVAGLGAGFPTAATEAQFVAIGADFGHRGGYLEESVEVMRRLWSGEPVSYRGRHVAFDDVRIAPTPSNPAGPQIWLAGDGRTALARVARVADGWLPYPPQVTGYAAGVRAIREAATRPVTAALYATLGLDEDSARARRRLRASIEPYYDAPLERVAAIQAMFAGSAAEAAAWLGGYVAAGARHLVIRLATDDHEAGLERLAAGVLPVLRGIRPETHHEEDL